MISPQNAGLKEGLNAPKDAVMLVLVLGPKVAA